MTLPVAVFYAHEKDLDGEIMMEECRTLARSLRDWTRARGQSVAFAVTPGLADWTEHSRQAGGWKGWPETVWTRYNLILVPDGRHEMVGNGTARIITAALQNSTSCYSIFGRPEATLRRVAIVGMDPDDRQGGDRRLHLAHGFNTEA